MIIKRLTLHNHNNLVLHQQNYHFVLEPTNDIILILGANGSGKSSILRECSPLPGSKQDYGEGGYKEIEIQHKKSTYLLRSDFTDGQHHSFLKDQTELNASHTVSVQKELVKQEFGLTPDIFAMINNEYGSTLTTMSPNERRKWFTLMDKTDYEFILRKYNKAKEQHRDAQGAVKTLTSRLLVETQSKATDEEYSALKGKVDTQRQVLANLIDKKSVTDGNLTTLTQQLNSVVKSLVATAKDVIHSNFTLKTSALTNQELMEPTKAVGTLTERQTQLAGQLTEVKLQAQQTQSLLQSASIDTMALDNEITEIESVVTDLTRELVYTEINPEDIQLLTVLDKVIETTESIVYQLPTDVDRRYTSKRLNELLLEIEQVEYQLSQSKTQAGIAEALIRKLMTDKDTHLLTCPNCNHQWLRSDIDIQIQTAEQQYDQFNTGVKQQQLVLIKLQEEKEACGDYLEKVSRYQQLRNYFNKPQWFWQPIDDSRLIRLNPIKIHEKLIDLKQSLVAHEQLNVLTKRLVQLKDQRAQAQQSAFANLEQLTAEFNLLETKLNELYQQEDLASHKLSLLNDFVNKQEHFNRSKDKFNALLNEKATLQNKLKQAIEQQLVNDAIFSCKKQLAELEQALNRIEQQDLIIKTLESNLHLAKEDVPILADCINVLSPKDGLIAATLLKFMQVFVKQMNTFIKDIWMYDLAIDIETIIDNDVDYKFPILVANNKKANDVRLGSSAMREIFDLAFKIIAMNHLGLHDYPLILDEFASTFDKEHRKIAYDTIATLTTNSGFEQIFIVSHYYDNFGVFNNADRYLLSDFGIDGVNA